MPGICPSCQRQATIESEFCPACGAPMNPDAYRIREERKQRTQILLPLKWHKFLTWVSLPLGGLSGLISLYTAVTTLLGFDPALYRPDAVQAVQIMMYLDVISMAVLIPSFILAEIHLLKMRWRGVKAVLFIYLFQAVYAAAALALYFRMGADMTNFDHLTLVTQLFTSMIGMIVMFFLVRFYYKKRRGLFQ
ncbi:MAG: zinc ribbon domain-containing protein [Clostridia bacterium]|nr:zinc ribbon domain-containing protein [Clostridia bacterium]